MIRYCDGSSFTGDVEAVDPVSHCRIFNGFKKIPSDVISNTRETSNGSGYSYLLQRSKGVFGCY